MKSNKQLIFDFLTDSLNGVLLQFSLCGFQYRGEERREINISEQEILFLTVREVPPLVGYDMKVFSI